MLTLNRQYLPTNLSILAQLFSTCLLCLSAADHRAGGLHPPPRGRDRGEVWEHGVRDPHNLEEQRLHASHLLLQGGRDNADKSQITITSQAVCKAWNHEDAKHPKALRGDHKSTVTVNIVFDMRRYGLEFEWDSILNYFYWKKWPYGPMMYFLLMSIIKGKF